MIYRYNLEKGSKKFNCPQCHKKTFVRFIDNETGDYLSHEFGRCDRENKCAYFSTPKGEYKNTYVVKYIPPPATSYHDYNLVTKSGCNFNQNNLIQFLKTIFTENEVKDVISKYLIGTSKHLIGGTIFWQIDNQENVRHGKVMLYDAITGKRKKTDEGKAFINSVRSILKLKDFNLKQCLFGLHLINESETQTIAIVEAEKTAIIMNISKPEYKWLSTGSVQGFKYDMMKPIKNYKIIAFPDKCEYFTWQSKAIELNKFGFNITVSQWLESTNYPDGTDLADVYLDETISLTSSIISPLVSVKHEDIEKDLYTIIPTKTDTLIHHMENKNPNILFLINEFGLTEDNSKEDWKAFKQGMKEQANFLSMTGKEAHMLRIEKYKQTAL